MSYGIPITDKWQRVHFIQVWLCLLASNHIHTIIHRVSIIKIIAKRTQRRKLIYQLLANETKLILWWMYIKSIWTVTFPFSNQKLIVSSHWTKKRSLFLLLLTILHRKLNFHSCTRDKIQFFSFLSNYLNILDFSNAVATMNIKYNME